ncbi:hypothetical protein HZC27_04330 [Candidatus Roizmanbacteria bacterium]|nr:hypothetical protein [Candidatus Roizmanbacteria bacterium]
MVKKILIFFISWRVLTFVLALLARPFISPQLTFLAGKFGISLPYFLHVWGNFDGTHYLEIARRGYQTWEQGFFPLYPFFVFMLQKASYLPYLLVALIVSNMSFFIASFLFYKLLLIDHKEKVSTLFFLCVFLWPTSFFYGAVYNDSLFLVLTLCTMYFARRNKWVLSSLVASFATLARLNGLALVIFIIAEYMEQKNIVFPFKRKDIIGALNSKLYAILLIPLFFAGYLGFIHLRFGNWQLLFTSMSIWGQDKTVFPLQVVWRYIKIVLLYPTFQFTYWVAVIEFGAFLLYVLIIFYSYRKIRWSYWIFFILSVLIPSLTGTFQGMPRYGLHLYPLFLSLALLLEKKSLPIKMIYFIISFLLLIFCLSFFTRGYFIA